MKQNNVPAYLNVLVKVVSAGLRWGLNLRVQNKSNETGFLIDGLATLETSSDGCIATFKAKSYFYQNGLS